MTQSGEDFEEVLKRLDIDRLKRLPVRSLSAGQQRRVALARMLLSRVPLWLMDEPFTNLDREGRALVMNLTTEHLDRRRHVHHGRAPGCRDRWQRTKDRHCNDDSEDESIGHALGDRRDCPSRSVARVEAAWRCSQPVVLSSQWLPRCSRWP